ILVANYFGELRDNLDLFASLPVAGLHVDAVRGAAEVEAVAGRIGGETQLSVGVVDGRNIWKTDFERALTVLRKAADIVGSERLMVGPSCSLIHSPVTLRSEQAWDDEFKNWLAFAEEKLAEIAFLAKAVDGDIDTAALAANKAALASRAA